MCNGIVDATLPQTVLGWRRESICRWEEIENYELLATLVFLAGHDDIMLLPRNAINTSSSNVTQI